MPQAELGRLLRPKACYPLAEAQAEPFEQAAWSFLGDRFYRYERRFGPFSRSVTLPHGVTESRSRPTLGTVCSRFGSPSPSIEAEADPPRRLPADDRGYELGRREVDRSHALTEQSRDDPRPDLAVSAPRAFHRAARR